MASNRPATAARLISVQCQDCPLKAVCLPASGAARRIDRREPAKLIAAHQQRMTEQGP